MGFGNLASQTILFIAIIILSTGLVLVFKSVVDDASGSMNFQGRLLSDKIQTDIQITNVYYNNITHRTTTYVKNMGKTKLDLDLIDIYLDQERLYRLASNRTIQVAPDTEITNPGIWDPKEEIEIVIFATLNQSKSHSVKVMTQYGVSDIDTFS